MWPQSATWIMDHTAKVSHVDYGPPGRLSAACLQTTWSIVATWTIIHMAQWQRGHVANCTFCNNRIYHVADMSPMTRG